MSRSVRRLAVLATLVLAGACGDREPWPDADPWIGIEVGAQEVRTGVAFPLTVVRVWDEALTPAAWDDRALTPLTLRLESLGREARGGRVRETRRYRAYAFTLDDVAIPAVPFAVRPTAGGDTIVVHASALRIAVRPALDAEAPGRPELPGPLVRPSAPIAPWIGLGLALLLAGIVLRRRSRRHVPSEIQLPTEEPDAPTPAEIALDALARVRMCSTGDATADVVEASEIVREYVEAAFGVRAPYRSTEEVLAASVLPAGPGRRLARLLGGSDLAKFAARVPTPAEGSDLLGEAELFVRETAEGATS